MEVAANKQSKGYFAVEPLWSASARQLFDNEIEVAKCWENGREKTTIGAAKGR